MSGENAGLCLDYFAAFLWVLCAGPDRACEGMHWEVFFHRECASLAEDLHKYLR